MKSFGYGQFNFCWMEKFYNFLCAEVSKKCSQGLTFCFPALKLFVGICNAVIVLIGGLAFGAAAIMQIIPKYHLFLSSMKHIFCVDTVFWSAIVLGALTVCLGTAGIYFLMKGYYDKLGLQAASYLIVLIVMSAITFTFWTEWEENAHFGVAYATQSYSPNDIHGTYFTSIQEFLLCCGSTGPRDYDIANEYFKYATVPISCCNHIKFPSNCSEAMHLKDKGKGSLAISVHMAFDSGCMTKMEKIIWPVIVYIIFIQSGLALICMLTSSMVVVGHQSYSKSRSAKSNKSDDAHDNDNDETLKLKVDD